MIDGSFHLFQMVHSEGLGTFNSALLSVTSTAIINLLLEIYEQIRTLLTIQLYPTDIELQCLRLEGPRVASNL